MRACGCAGSRVKIARRPAVDVVHAHRLVLGAGDETVEMVRSRPR